MFTGLTEDTFRVTAIVRRGAADVQPISLLLVSPSVIHLSFWR